MPETVEWGWLAHRYSSGRSFPGCHVPAGVGREAPQDPTLEMKNDDPHIRVEGPLTNLLLAEFNKNRWEGTYPRLDCMATGTEGGGGNAARSADSSL